MNIAIKRTLPALAVLALAGTLAACDPGPEENGGFEQMGFEQPTQQQTQPENRQQQTEQPFGQPEGNSYSDQ